MIINAIKNFLYLIFLFLLIMVFASYAKNTDNESAKTVARFVEKGADSVGEKLGLTPKKKNYFKRKLDKIVDQFVSATFYIADKLFDALMLPLLLLVISALTVYFFPTLRGQLKSML